jgi:hypothetical protein
MKIKKTKKSYGYENYLFKNNSFGLVSNARYKKYFSACH